VFRLKLIEFELGKDIDEYSFNNFFARRAPSLRFFDCPDPPAGGSKEPGSRKAGRARAANQDFMFMIEESH